MPERKSRARKLAEEQYVLDIANKFVGERETKYLNDLVCQARTLMDLRPVEAQETIDELHKEKRRLDPRGKWDEEEVMISVLEQNGKGTQTA